jgi:membrane protein DedA with SNARE-associated domain
MVPAVHQLVATHGYSIVALTVALESMGIPLPGETMLVSAAVYAGSTHQLSIATLVLAAATGGIVGDNVGFWIGRRYGYGFLRQHGRRVGLDESRLRVGQLLFDRHGGKVVFFGRFVALLRIVAALLAGVNRMRWRRFLLFNAAGALLWAAGYGTAAYLLGGEVERARGPFGIALLLLAAAVVIAVVRYVRRHEAALAREAERQYGGAGREHAGGATRRS